MKLDLPDRIASWVPATNGHASALAHAASHSPHTRRLAVLAFARFKWLAVGTALLLGAPLIALVWWTYSPSYESRASVEVSPIIPRIVYNTDDNGLIPLYQQYLNNQALVLHSPVVLERVLDKPEIRATRWYRFPPAPLWGAPPRPLERLQADLKAQVRPNTSFVDVRLESAHPEEAALIVNTVVDEYLEYVHEKARRIDDDVYQALTQEYNSLLSTIDGLKGVVSNLRGELLTADPKDLQGQQRQRLDAKTAALETLRQKIKLAEWERDELSKRVSERSAGADSPGGSHTTDDSATPPSGGAVVAAAASVGPAPLSVFVADSPAKPAGPPAPAGTHTAVSGSAPAPSDPRFAMDPQWRDLFVKVEQARHELETAAASYGADHPHMADLRRAVTHAEQDLASRESQLNQLLQLNPGALFGGATAQQTPEQRLKSLDFDLQRLRYEESLQAADVEQERGRVERTSGKAELLIKEQDDLAHAQQRFEDIRQRKVAMEVERRAPASIRVQDRGFAATQANNAFRPVILSTMLILLACIAGAAVALLRAAADPTVEQSRDFAHSVNAPVLGQVSLHRRSVLGGPSQSQRLEQVRMIRTALLERIADGRSCIVQITSAGPGAGKSSAALLLAESLERCGKRVLLVDADFRKPSLGAQNGGDSPGLAELLLKQAAPELVVRHHAGLNVDIVCAGAAELRNPELLSGAAFAAQLEDWRREYDLVLLDSSPLLCVADARIVARQVDGNVVVVREGHCRRGDVMEALSQLRTAGGTLLGFILFSRRGGAGMYGYGYGAAYGAYGESAAAETLDVRTLPVPGAGA